jgi:hypothetical protein
MKSHLAHNCALNQENPVSIKRRACARHPTKEARFMVGFVYLCGLCADEQRRQGYEPVRLN